MYEKEICMYMVLASCEEGIYIYIYTYIGMHCMCRSYRKSVMRGLLWVGKSLRRYFHVGSAVFKIERS